MSSSAVIKDEELSPEGDGKAGNMNRRRWSSRLTSSTIPDKVPSSGDIVSKSQTKPDSYKGVASSNNSSKKRKTKGISKGKGKSNGNSKKRIKSEKSESGLVRPTPMECKFATDVLAQLHPEVVTVTDESRKNLLESCGMRDDVTDAIVSTMLSQNTTDANSKAAYKSLKDTFPTWEDVASCEDISKIEQSIKVAGLAKTRAERIQSMLRTVKEERGVASLNYIKNIDADTDIKKELSRFKGLGPKTISCVLLFALGRNEFPVDTHVLRISKSMGWVGAKDTRESAYEHLNAAVPNEVKMDLHCLLVRHGKCCHRCASNGRPQFPPETGILKCPLAPIKSWGGNVPRKEEPEMKNTIIKKEEILIKIKSECTIASESRKEKYLTVHKKRIKVEETDANEDIIGSRMKESKYFKE